jgi:protein-tyrosine phosphatase
MKKQKILFVCLGNICRSPTADGIMRKLIAENNLQDVLEVDSAGTGAWHIGSAPDARSTKFAGKRGYDLKPLRARKVMFEDFENFDLIFAMDNANYEDLVALAEHKHHHKIKLFLSEHGDDFGRKKKSVPDPYYQGDEGFEEVLDLLEAACRNLVKKLQS